MKATAKSAGPLVAAAVVLAVSVFVTDVLAEKDAGGDQDLEERVEILTEEVSRLREQMNIPETDKELEGVYGMGPAASKVYGVSQGVSFGGYGEFYFASPYGDTDITGRVNTTDFYRFITYIGYKFNDWIVMNGEIEYEHATTSENYQGKSGSISVEFAYLDFLFNKGFNVRGGNLLIPMGFLNLVHEPPTYFGNIRPVIEQTIIPTTWREMGLGAHGDFGGGFRYSAYVVNGFNADKFNSTGVRGGRQKANRAIWEDVGGVLSLDYYHGGTFRIGGSVYAGGADQGLVADSTGAAISVNNEIFEGHAEYSSGGFRARALVAASHISNAAALSAALFFDDDDQMLTQQVPENQFGWYAEAGYDVAPLLWSNRNFTLSPWVRYEQFDFQASVAAGTGLSADPGLDGALLTVGLETKPHPTVVVKLDWVHPTDQSTVPLSDEIRLGAGFIY